MISRTETIRVATCDEVFELLTRAPFPSGDSAADAAVERHLRCCHECRNLAEALRPATSELAETLPAEANQLPQVSGDYWRKVESAWENPQSPPALSSGVWLSLAIPITAVCVSFFALASYWASPNQPAARGSASRNLAQAQHEAERYLTNLALPAVCSPTQLTPKSETIALASFPQQVASLAHLTCCSECHHRAKEKSQSPAAAASSAAALVAVANSCQACHTP
ncbi:MAG: hypothetical protein ACIALR_06265 [Blastopirellula sp. JB062]